MQSKPTSAILIKLCLFITLVTINVAAANHAYAKTSTHCDSILLVSSWFNNQVKIYDGCNGGFISNLDESGIIKGPLGLVRLSDGNIVVLSEGNDQLVLYKQHDIQALVRGDTSTISGKVVLNNANNQFIKKPVGASLAKDNRHMFVVSYETNEVVLIDTHTWERTQTITSSSNSVVKGADAGILIEDNTLWVPGYDSDNIMTVDLNTNTVRQLVSANSGGLDAARSIVAVNNELLVTSERSNAVLKFDKITGEFNGTFMEAVRPAHIVLDGPEHILLTTRKAVYRISLSDRVTTPLVKPGAGKLNGATFVMRLSTKP